jgi:hypothetical protein
MTIPRVDLTAYPFGHEAHSQSLNVLYVNGIEPFTLKHGVIQVVGNRLTISTDESTQRTLPMKSAAGGPRTPENAVNSTGFAARSPTGADPHQVAPSPETGFACSGACAVRTRTAHFPKGR